MVGRRQAWHDINVLGRTHDRTTSGVTLHHRPWTTHPVGRRQAWHDIIAFGQHTWSDDVGRVMPLSPLGSTHGRTTSGVACHHRLWAAHTVERRWRGMLSSPLGSTDGRTTSGVACHHIPWTTHMVGRRRAWHAIIAFGQHTRSNNVGRGMPSSSSGSTHGRTTSGVACHHCLWAAHTIRLRRELHDITALGQHTRLNDVGHGMKSPP